MNQDATWYGGRPRFARHLLDGDPAPPFLKGGGAGSPIFGQCPLWPNGRMDSDVTWYGERPRPRRLCVRWEPRSPSSKGGGAKFSTHVCGQTAGWIKMTLGTDVGLRPGDFVLDGDSAPSQKNGGNPSPQFSALVYCRQTAAWIKMPLCTEVGHGLRDIVLDGERARRGSWVPNFWPMSVVAKRLDGLRCHLVWR